MRTFMKLSAPVSAFIAFVNVIMAVASVNSREWFGAFAHVGAAVFWGWLAYITIQEVSK